MDLDEVDGYAVRRPLGAGSVGSAWLARDLASGRPVVLKRVPATEVPVPELFRRDLALAQGLRHPHVARLLAIRQTDDEWVLVSEYVAAGTLADLLQRRGPLSRGELVTLVAPLAQALTAAHDAGLTHGHLGCGDVMFTADGRPVLTDFGLRLTAGRESGPAADDLLALRDIALRAGAEPKVFSLKLFAGDGASLADRVLALTGPAPVNLGFDHPAGDPSGTAGPEAFRSGLARPRRPGTARRGASRRRVGRPFGVRGRLAARKAKGGRPDAGPPTLPDDARVHPGPDAGDRHTPADSPARPGSPPGVWPELVSRVRLAHGLLVVTGLAAIVVLGVGVAMLRTADGPGPAASGAATPGESAGAPTGAPTGGTTGAPTGGTTGGTTGRAERGSVTAAGWLRMLRALDVRRSRAFAAGDLRGLDAVYVRGSAPWTSDRSLLASYRDRGLRVVGLEIRIERLVVDRAAPERVVLRVVDRLIAGAAVDRAGRRAVLPPGRPAERLITLARSGSDWRIVGVVAA